MKLLKRLVTAVWVLGLIVAGCLLYLFNSTPVTLDFIWFDLTGVSLALTLAVTFFIGACFGGVLTLAFAVWPKRRVRP